MYICAIYLYNAGCLETIFFAGKDSVLLPRHIDELTATTYTVHSEVRSLNVKTLTCLAKKLNVDMFFTGEKMRGDVCLLDCQMTPDTYNFIIVNVKTLEIILDCKWSVEGLSSLNFFEYKCSRFLSAVSSGGSYAVIVGPAEDVHESQQLTATISAVKVLDWNRKTIQVRPILAPGC